MTRDPEAMRYKRPSIRARVIKALRDGPASERTLAILLNVELHAVATCLKALRADGIVRRIGPIGLLNGRHRGSVFQISDFAFADSG